MGCQKVKRGKMEGCKWTAVVKLELLAVLVVGTVVVSGMPVGDNSVGFAKQGFGLRRLPYKSMSISKQQHQQLQKQQQNRRLKQTGNEIIPAVGANDISDEPTCEELRAMWRYYKRQSRAELTNEIPQFGKNPFFELLPAPPRNPIFPSFGLGSKARNRNRMRQQQTAYGRVITRPKTQKERQGGRNKNPKPFEIVRDMMRNPGSGSSSSKTVGDSSSSAGGESAGDGVPAPAVVIERVTSTPPSAIVHYSPPPHPPKESSFRKLKEIISHERMREKGPPALVATKGNGGNMYGTVMRAPPPGQDGRRINKPLELMTAFEKIRFGHADDILDEGIRGNQDVMKRRTLPLSVLKTQWKQHQQQQQPYQSLQKRRFLSNPMLFLTSSSSPRSSGIGDAGSGGDSRSATFTSSKYFGNRGEAEEEMTEENNNNNNIIARANDKQQLDSIQESLPTQLEDNASPLSNDNNSNNDNNVIITNGGFTDYIIDGGGQSGSTSQSSSALLPPKYTNPRARQTVEMPTCAEVEHEPCNQTLDCSCVGFALYRCYLNQCQILPLAFSVQDELVPEDKEDSSSSGDSSPDIWHSEPIPSEKLGLWEDPGVDEDSVAAARLSTIRARKNIRNEGKSNARLTDSTYLVLQGQNLYAT